MTKLSWAAAAVKMVSAATQPTTDVAARGRDVVEELRGLVPYSGALLARWNTHTRSHTPVATVRYPTDVTEAFVSPRYVADPKWPVMQQLKRPLRWADVPGQAGASPFYNEVLEPHGFLEGVTLPVYDGQAYVGMLVMNVESRTPPHDDVMELLSACAPALGRLLAPAADGRSAMITTDGSIVQLDDVDAGPPAGVIAAARTLMSRGRVPARFMVQAVDAIYEAQIAAADFGATTFIVKWSKTRLPRGLTSRELEIVSALADGLSNGEISAIFGISDRTVSTHVEHILRKLEVGTRTAAAATVIGEGLYLPIRSGS